jgi:hypothetical protein
MNTLELTFKGSFPPFLKRFRTPYFQSGSKNVVMEVLGLDAELGHENSRAFSQYLNNQGLKQALSESKLRMKSKHTILPYVSHGYGILKVFGLNRHPQRIGAQIDSPHTTLPSFSSEDSWYFNVSHRLVNFCYAC